jgi:hypothetical protein
MSDEKKVAAIQHLTDGEAGDGDQPRYEMQDSFSTVSVQC